MKMEMESLHNPNQAETAGPGPSSQRTSYRDAQVWKDIKAETGFASYEEYMEFYEDVRPDFDYKLQWRKIQELQFEIDRREGKPVNTNNTVIYDISMHEGFPAQLSLRCYCESGTELIQALRKPPDGVCVQLVLCLRTNSPLNQEMVDTLGLGLRLDLDDFDYRERWSPPPRKSGPRIKSIFGDQTVAAISQGFMRDLANEVPVVLVASASGLYLWRLLASNITINYCERPPFCKSPTVFGPFDDNRSDNDDHLGMLSLAYARAVQNFIVQDRDLQPTKQSLLLSAMSPLLYAAACRTTESFNRFQDLYTRVIYTKPDESTERKDDDKSRLDMERLELRRITEVDENLLGQFSRCLGSEAQLELSEQPSYVAIVAELRSLIADARRLDAEVRDFKQIQVGDLALKESHKSIELSNAQIREAKSGKFPTNVMCVDYTNVF